MKTIHIIAPTEYVAGHLRYGHYEGNITLTDDEFAKFQANPDNFLYDTQYLYDLDLVVDSYCVEDVGSIYDIEYQVEN